MYDHSISIENDAVLENVEEIIRKEKKLPYVNIISIDPHRASTDDYIIEIKYSTSPTNIYVHLNDGYNIKTLRSYEDVYCFILYIQVTQKAVI